MLYPIKKDPHDSRDYLHIPKATSPDQLPVEATINPNVPPVFNQLNLGSCTANGLDLAREYWMNRWKQKLTPLSRLYLYWYERNAEGTVNADSGAHLRDGCKILQQQGCAPETDFPYVVVNFKDKPSTQADKDAAAYKISSYRRITDLHGLKDAIHQGIPVVISVAVYTSFESSQTGMTGNVPMPNKTQEKWLGGHAILVTGYNDKTQKVEFANSWGQYWGVKGHGFLPYSYIEDPTLTWDMWAIVVDAPEPKITFEEAVQYLDSPDYWIAEAERLKDNPDFQYEELAIRKLAQQIADLQAENAALKKQVADLQAQLAALKKG